MPGDPPLGSASVVIAAHNEENILGATLEALLAQSVEPRLEIIVSANGCSDQTAAVASRAGVTVIDRPEPGKTGALNAAEQVATGFPRIYLDADIIVPPSGIQALLNLLSTHTDILAAMPRRKMDTTGRPWPVRGYFAINERLPVFRHGLFGRGMIALSKAGRGRFDSFPTVIADDLFLDGQFTDAEKAEAEDVEVVIQTPHTTRDLLRRLVRVRRGSAQLRAMEAAGQVSVQVRTSDRWSWLRDVVLREPRLAFAAVPYVAITLAAGILARRPPRAGQEWGRDESTRNRPGGAG